MSSLNFIEQIIESDLPQGSLVTRFPPEPNGYLHIGHAKSICLNFGLAQKYGGRCHLRFDDTNPETEEMEFEKSIMEDIRWLGFDWGPHLYYASDYFERLHAWAVELIKNAKAYVDSQSIEDIRRHRGTLTEPGKISPYRDRGVSENLILFEKMRTGQMKEGECVLRAKIDMASPNMNLRDPLLYRIKHQKHHRVGDQWYIYPLYDFAHGQSDSIESITHSICTLEFEDHRPLYDWFLNNLSVPSRPQQIEFARLNLNYTVTSKRRLKELVDGGYVQGWDDPRMPTLQGMRRRGVRPEAIRNFVDRVGVTKKNTVSDYTYLETCIREDLEDATPRVLAVLHPIKLTLTNYPEKKVEWIETPLHPKNETLGNRKIPFSNEVYIDREDFMEDPPKGYFRLRPGGEVRLRYGYIVKCTEVIKNAQGELIELRGEVDLSSLGKKPEDGRKVKGIIHWVSAHHHVPLEVRLYDRLFSEPEPSLMENYLEALNPNSLVVVKGALGEICLNQLSPGEEHRFQFERVGFFCTDRKESSPEALIFNRIVPLRDTWAKVTTKDGA